MAGIAGSYPPAAYEPTIATCKAAGDGSVPDDLLIRQTLDCLAGAVPAGTRVIVFGSRARGTARPDSDIDLLIIEPEVGDRYREMARLSTLLGRRLIPADVVVMSKRAFETERMIINTLAWNAFHEGETVELAG